MKVQALHSLRSFFLSLIALFSSYLLFAGVGDRNNEVEVDVRIFTSSDGDSLRLKSLEFVKRKSAGKNYIDATVSHTQLLALRSSGFQVELLRSSTRNRNVPRSYRPLEEIETDLHLLEVKYSDILHVEKIGQSTALKLPIWGAKVSDHAVRREDEPRILFMGVHHAREPIGANICLHIIKSLCEAYGRDARITRWVDETEIWLVPVVNPDGYKYVMDNNLSFPWWRKNLRDNDGDGLFNPLYDGVDLNRNYDFNWGEGGDGKPSSWFYRGSRPFSESETMSILRLAQRENFVFGISYHSYGESILFPWGNFDRPPDLELIMEVASNLAARISKQSGHGQYSILPLNGRVGQSSIWMYGHLRILDYIIEVGTEYFPADEHVDFILQEQLKGAYYLLDRMLQTGIKGRVFDAQTHEPLFASIEVMELSAGHVRPRLTDREFGSFYRLLNPGDYTLEVRSAGYAPRTVRGVKVRKGSVEELAIGLYRKAGVPANGTHSANGKGN